MKPCVFGIDDAHWIDPDSWNFLIDLEREVNAILILTTRPLERMEKKPPALVEILNHPHTKVIHMQGLDSEEMVELTCRQLEVDSIPPELKEIIYKRSHGVPLWCEELVGTMLELNYVKIVELSDDEGKEKKNKRQITLLNNMRRQSVDGEGLLARDIPIPDSVTGMVLARIDHMSASEQMTFKCASVIGTVFTKTMLQAILPNCNPMAFHNSLQALAEAGIVECALLSKARSMMSDQEEVGEAASLPRIPSSLECACLEKADIMNHAHHTATHKHHTSYPPVDECETLQFVHNYVQETAYNLCTEAQRKTLHTSAAHFLENHAHKCKNCGGGDFIGGRTQSLIRKKRKCVTRRVYVGAGGTRLQNKSVQGSPTLTPTDTPRMSITGAGQMENSEAEQRISEAGRRSSEPGRRSSEAGRRTSEADKRRRSSSASTKLREATTDRRKLSVNSLKLSSSNTTMIVESCHCDEVLAKVYPQLVRHWRAAGDMHNTMVYLIEEASAAVATCNNMEALSLLQEAKEIYEDLDKTLVSNQELGRMQSLRGQVSLHNTSKGFLSFLCCLQTLYQMGQVEESMSYFYQALRFLDTTLPKTLLGGSIALVYHTIKQFRKCNCPTNSIPQLSKDEPFLDRARCLAHISHAYHLQHNNTMSLMTILKRLNEADRAQEYHVYEVTSSRDEIV